MATLADAAADIRARFEAQWTSLHPEAPVLWPNERLTPAPDPNTDQNGQQGWVAFEIQTGKESVSEFAASGNNRWRQYGTVIIRLFTPVTAGDALVRSYAVDACTIFRGWQTGDLKFYQASTTGGDIQEDGNWYELDVLASFTFDLAG